MKNRILKGKYIILELKNDLRELSDKELKTEVKIKKETCLLDQLPNLLLK